MKICHETLLACKLITKMQYKKVLTDWKFTEDMNY